MASPIVLAALLIVLATELNVLGADVDRSGPLPPIVLGEPFDRTVSFSPKERLASARKNGPASRSTNGPASARKNDRVSVLSNRLGLREKPLRFRL